MLCILYSLMVTGLAVAVRVRYGPISCSNRFDYMSNAGVLAGVLDNSKMLK